MKTSVNYDRLALFFLCALALVALMPDAAWASSSGTSLEWESPLEKFRDSIKGPVAFGISLLGIIVAGGTLVWGGEINEFTRRFVMLIMVISLLVFATNILSTLFGVSGAVIAGGTVLGLA